VAHEIKDWSASYCVYHCTHRITIMFYLHVGTYVFYSRTKTFLSNLANRYHSLISECCD